MDADLRTTGAIAAWLARSSVRLGVRVSRGVIDLGKRLINR